MGSFLSEEEFDKQLADVLKKKGYDTCNSCGRSMDRGDISWSEGSTEAGTPWSYVEIICQKCDNEVARIASWYPGIERYDELIYVIDKDG